MDWSFFFLLFNHKCIKETYVAGSGNVRYQPRGGLRRHRVLRQQHQALCLAEVWTAPPVGWNLRHRRLRTAQLPSRGRWDVSWARRQRGAPTAARWPWTHRCKRETFQGRSQGGVVGGGRKHGQSSETAAERQTEKSKNNDPSVWHRIENGNCQETDKFIEDLVTFNGEEKLVKHPEKLKLHLHNSSYGKHLQLGSSKSCF